MALTAWPTWRNTAACNGGDAEYMWSSIAVGRAAAPCTHSDLRAWRMCEYFHRANAEGRLAVGTQAAGGCLKRASVPEGCCLWTALVGLLLSEAA
jgi:hypothetical protein